MFSNSRINFSIVKLWRNSTVFSCLKYEKFSLKMSSTLWPIIHYFSWSKHSLSIKKAAKNLLLAKLHIVHIVFAKKNHISKSKQFWHFVFHLIEKHILGKKPLCSKGKYFSLHRKKILKYCFIIIGPSVCKTSTWNRAKVHQKVDRPSTQTSSSRWRYCWPNHCRMTF